MIVQSLHKIQKEHGFLPKSELRTLAYRTSTPLYKINAVVSFFPHFRTEKPPRTQVRVCQDMSCRLRGSFKLEKFLKGNLAADQNICVESVSCLGRCDRAPAIVVEQDAHESVYLKRGAADFQNIIVATSKGNPPLPDLDDGIERQTAEPWKIDCYGANQIPPYSAVRRLTDAREKELERDKIIKALETGQLLGMGGAGGRAYKKWTDVREAKGDIKYVVSNGDESEPGTFKDRELLLRAPHLVVEGVILGGLVVGAQRGYVYIRHEFEEQIEAVRKEIKRAVRMGACGKNIFDSNMDFEVEVFVSPGGYICGEQTALIEAMEDKRGEPRNRPPELQTNGLWDKPTLLNNVETLSWVPAIVLKDDGQWFADSGKGKYAGTRFFSISGDLNKPGAYEVPIGITLGELINDYAGGMKDGREFKAAALSGPSGGFTPRMLPVEFLSKGFRDKLPPEQTHYDIFDMVLDIRVSRQMGVMLGAGMVVFSETADMVQAAQACSEFYRNESCGKCVPCRIGSQKLVEICTDVTERKTNMEQIYGSGMEVGRHKLVKELAATMKLTAICGLGTVAPNPLETLFDHFPDEVETYLRKGRSR